MPRKSLRDIYESQNLDKIKNARLNSRGLKDFTYMVLDNGDFKGLDLSDFDFSGSSLKRCAVNEETKFSEKALKGAQLHNINFVNRDLRAFDFTDTVFHEVKIDGTILPKSINKAKELKFFLEWGDLVVNEKNLDDEKLLEIITNSKISVDSKLGDLEARPNLSLDIFAASVDRDLDNLLKILEKAKDIDSKIAAPVLKSLESTSKESIQKLLLNQKERTSSKQFLDLIYALSTLSKQVPEEKVSKMIVSALDKQFIRQNFQSLSKISLRSFFQKPIL